MTTSMAASLPCSHATTSFAQSGRASTRASGVGVHRVSGLGARVTTGFENGRGAQCSSSWVGGELRRRVFVQRRAVTSPNSGRLTAEEKPDVFKGSSRLCNPRLFSDPLGGRLPPKTVGLQIRASQSGESILPRQVDSNGVATLESLLGASPREIKGNPPSRKEDVRERLEALIEQAIFNCRFLTLMAVFGSLAGSVLCFFKGSLYVTQSFLEYFQASWQGLSTSQVVFLLVEAVDVYLMGTVMLIFGMGLYELFVSTLEVVGENCEEVRNPVCGSNLFGLFRMRERPKWLEIRSLDELKTKLGHVIVMILLVGMFEKSKKVPINSGLDLLCFSASILLSSGCLFLLSKLHSSTHH